MDHNTRDQVGVVESVNLGERRGRAVVRFGKSARASEIFQDVMDDIRQNVSVGYAIHEIVLEKSSDDGEVYRVTDWEPMEVSIVSVPADTSVGVGRDFDPRDLLKPQSKESKKMDEDENNIEEPQTPATRSADQGGNAPDVKVIEGRAQTAERTRVTNLLKVGSDYNASELAQKMIAEGGSVADLNAAILERDKNANDGRLGDEEVGSGDPQELGLSHKEREQFSFRKLMHAAASQGDRAAVKDAAFELEVARETTAMLQRDDSRTLRSDLCLPYDVLSQPITGNRAVAERAMAMVGAGQRDLSVGTASAGGNLVATDLLGSSFIDILRNRSIVMQLATVFSDMVGNFDIPRQTAAATAAWLATEQAAAGQTEPAFDQISFSPKEIGNMVEYTRRLLIQSSIDIEAFVRLDMALGMAIRLDSAVF